MLSHLNLIYLTIFHRYWRPTSTPWILKIIVFPKEKKGFFKKSLFEVGIDFWSNFVPTCLHFASKNPPKSFQKSIPRCIVFSIDFCIDVSSILVRFGRPTWSHVGPFFVQKGATLNVTSVVYVGSVFFFGFWGVLAPPWRPLGSIWEGSGLHFGGFRCPFSLQFPSFLHPFLKRP